LLLILLFAAITLVFLYDVLIGPNIFLDRNPARYDPWRAVASASQLQSPSYWQDSFLTYLPRRTLLSQRMRNGEIPLWNPNILAGAPFLADPLTRVFYTIELLLLLVEPAKAMGLDAPIHILLAMLGMYLFLRSAGVSTEGAILGALTYAVSSFFYSRYGHPTPIASAAWIPFFFYGFELAWQSARLGTLGLAIFFAMGYLAGFLQVFLFGVCAVAFYGLYLSLAEKALRRRSLVRYLKIMVASRMISILIVSFQLISFVEYYFSSHGLHYPEDYVTTVFVTPPLVLLRSLLPMFFGNPVNGTDWSDLPRELVHAYNPDFAVYCGIGTLVLALVALGNPRRSPRLQLLSILVIASTGVATNSYLLRLGYRLLPMSRASRLDRIAVIGGFAIALMAASGLDCFKTTPWRTRNYLLVAIAITAGITLAVTLVLEFHGLAMIEHYANKLLSFPKQHWYRLANLSRSGRVKEWAQTGQSARLALASTDGCTPDFARTEKSPCQAEVACLGWDHSLDAGGRYSDSKGLLC